MKLKLAKLYITTFLLFTFIFIALFHSPLFSSQPVLFYRGLGFFVITIFFVGLILVWSNMHLFKLRCESVLAALIMSASLNLVFFVVLPVTFDRSVTMYVLNVVDKKREVTATCQGLSEKKLEQYVRDDYVQNQGAVKKRIEEQSIIGFLDTKKECISLTNRTKRFLQFSEMIKKIYSIK